MNHDKPDMHTTLANYLTIDGQTAQAQTVPEELRRAGADYVNRGKVKLQTVDSPGTAMRALTGSVQCGFGIVHTPSVSLRRRGGQILVDRHQCGCREGARGRFCAHCAALLVAHYGHADAWIVPEEPAESREGQNLKGTRVRLGTIRETGEPVYWTPEDTERLATANMAVIGGSDTGNTQMMESVTVQLLRQKAEAGEEIGILVFDGMGEYTESRTDFLEATGARVMRLRRMPLNPFSLRGLERKPQLHTHTAMTFADALARAYGLGALQKSTLVQSILAAYAARSITSDPVTWDLPAPTFEDVYEEYCSRPLAQRSDALAQVMESLSLFDLFDPEAQETTLFEMLRGTLVVDMSGYPEELQRFAVGVLLEMLYAQMCASRRSLGRRLRKLILVDDADALLAAGSCGLEGLLTQGREFGVALLLSAQSVEGFRGDNFDFRKWVRTWVIHNVESLRKADLEFLLQMDIYDSALERLYHASRRLQKLHSLIRIGTETPVLAEDLPFYEIAGDVAQSYLIQDRVDPEPEPLAGMPLLDTKHLDSLVTLEDLPAGPMETL